MNLFSNVCGKFIYDPTPNTQKPDLPEGAVSSTELDILKPTVRKS